MAHIPIRVSTLRGDQQIDFDAFVKINDKQVLYCRKGDSFEGTRLSRLKEKKLKKMFIIDGHEENYRKYLERNIDVAFDPKSGKSLETRAEILQGTTQAKAEDIMEAPANAILYDNAKKDMARFIDCILKEKDVLKHMLNIENLDQNLAQHGVAVSSLAVALADKMGMKDAKAQQFIALGALLHDIDHQISGFHFAKPVAQMSKAELEIYHKHPTGGYSVLADKPHMDQAVVTIVAQHEETSDGKGFPKSSIESKIDPLALIVSSANKADRMLSFEGVKRADIAKELINRYLGIQPLDHLKILGELAKG